MQIYYEFFISATISSPKMTRDSNELIQLLLCTKGATSRYFELIFRSLKIVVNWKINNSLPW